MAYEFHYTPTGTGVISGKEVLEQTEDAINDLGNTAISGVQEALDKAEQALTNSANAVDDAQTALNTANNAEGVAIQAQNDVSNLSGTITNIGNRVTTAEGNITNLQGRMTTAEGNITNLQGRMTTAETNIGNLQTAVSTAQATANSAQQTATTARQQSYVLRYSSSSVTNNSTIAYSTLDNTDNIKSGDKVIDVDGKIFSVVSVDTTNQTVTVGSALIDLALDANVVHTSGNETISGAKTFSNTPVIYNSDISGSTANLYLRNQLVTKGDISSSGNQTIRFADANDKILGRIQLAKVTNGNTTLNLRADTIDSNNVDVTAEVQIIAQKDGNKSFSPQLDNAIDLGRTSAKWQNLLVNQINGLTPSSLGLPSNTEYVDISGYFTNTGDVQTNTYTASVNGWIYLNVVATKLIMQIRDSNNNVVYADMCNRSNDGTIYMTIPIGSGNKLLTQWFTSSSVTVTTARFIPCQGNI